MLRSLRPWLLLPASFAAALVAQEPAVDDAELERRIVAACGELRERAELVTAAELTRQAKATKSLPGFTAPRPPKAPPLAPAAEDLRDRLLASVCVVGHYYLCAQCDEWHFSAASGFAAGAGGIVATCAHVLPPGDDMREAYLVVADFGGRVAPVRRVLAADADRDLCVLATGLEALVPIPCAERVRVGQRLYCLSSPDHRFGYFSEGVLARRYLEPPGGDDGQPGDGPPVEWLHVTCAFAKGSSGAPIVDAMGHLVGIAQSTTTVVYDEDEGLDVQMVFRSAVPAAALHALAREVPAGRAPK